MGFERCRWYVHGRFVYEGKLTLETRRTSRFMVILHFSILHSPLFQRSSNFMERPEVSHPTHRNDQTPKKAVRDNLK